MSLEATLLLAVCAGCSDRYNDNLTELNMNAEFERFFGSLKRECLDHLILLGESPLQNAAREYVAHDHAERNQQGLEMAVKMGATLAAENRARGPRGAE